MKKITLENLRLWQFDKLSRESSIRHFITDRNSNAGGKEFTLGYTATIDTSEIQNNRNLVAAALGVSSTKLYFPNQVHKTKIVTVTNETSYNEIVETDALITNQTGIGIAVLAADCVSILLYDKKNNAIAAVHSGWRGTVARILQKTLLEMNRRFGTTGNDLVAGIGPSVCQESYQVGEEVVEAVNIAFGSNSGLMILQDNQKAKLDLWKANTLQLLEFGVQRPQIEISDLCTVKNNTDFFSARRGDTGRFAACIMLT